MFDRKADGAVVRSGGVLAALMLASTTHVVPAHHALAAGSTRPETARIARAVRVDRESFWYERLPRWSEREPWEVQAAPPGSSARLERLLGEVLRRHADDFPQPPPIDVVVQAPPREQLDTLAGYVANRTSYGGARRVGRTVYIDVNQSVFSGPDRLNDAEIRAFLGHELVHAYQYAHGRAELGHREIFEREVVAYTWELSHAGPDVRSAYRGDIFVNLHMYRDMLGE